MIKGRYVALVEIDIAVDENTEGLLPFDEIQKEFQRITPELKNLIESEISDGVGTVTITEQYRDLYLVPKEDGE